MQKMILVMAAVSGALAVAIGAFGAHGLKPLLERTQRLETFEIAVKYHFYHTLAMLIIGLAKDRFKSAWIGYSALFMASGIVLFSGSLYMLAILNLPGLGIITPFGGLLLMLGWIFLGIGFFKTLK